MPRLVPERLRTFSMLAVGLALFVAGAPANVVAQLPEVAIERSTAQELGLAVGDTIRLGPAPDSLKARAVVQAIFEAKPDPSTVMRRDRYLRLHLPDLAALLGAPDRVDRFGVALVPGTDPSRAAAGLNQVAFGFQAFPS